MFSIIYLELAVLLFLTVLLIEINDCSSSTVNIGDNNNSPDAIFNRNNHNYQPEIFNNEDQLGNSDYPDGNNNNNHNNNIAKKNKEHDTSEYYDVDSLHTTTTNHNHINGNSNNNNEFNSDDSTLSMINQFNRIPEKEYLSHEISEKACRLDRGCQRKDRLNNTYLSYCSRYKLENLLSSEILMSIMHKSVNECEKILDEFIQLDELINQFDRLFKNLLTRYNCHNGYSVKWSCEDCKKAYKDWLCATNLPYFMNGERIKPCISFCERVEQRCPYLHPISKEQYGGQPVFICRDPNIPFVPEITPDIPYSEPSRCYDLCHLSENLTELIADSLSKYHYDKCPDKGDLAEEVRSDPKYCNLDTTLDLQQFSNETSTTTLSGSYDLGEFDLASGSVGSESYTPHNIHNNHSQANKPDQHNNHYASYPHHQPKTSIVSPSAAGGHVHIHTTKLNELREVLTIYKSQPKTHKFGHHSEHASFVQSTFGSSTKNNMMHMT